MPALVALGPLVVALVAALLAIAADIIIQAIASQLPKINLVVATIKLGDIFANAANGVLNWAIGNLDQYFDDLADWFVGHIEAVLQFGGAAVSAISHLGDQVAHIVTVSIPNAIDAAEANAGATAHRLVAGVEADLTSDFNTLTDTLKGDVKQIYSDVSTDVTNLTNLVSKSVAAGVSTAENYTDDAITATRTFIGQQITDAEKLASSEVSSLASSVGQQLATLTDTVANNLQAAEAYARAQANTVFTELTSTIGSDVATLQAGIGTAEAAASAAATAAASDLVTAENFATTAAGSALSTAEQDTATAVTGAANTAEQALEGALGGIYTDLTGKALAVNGDLSGAESMIAGAILTAVGAVAARVGKLEECSVGVCDDSPNNFSSLLNAALGLAEFAGIGAILAEMIANPAGSAGTYAPLFSGLVSDGQSAFDALLQL